MNKHLLISTFHQTPSLIHNADVHLPALMESQRELQLSGKPKIDMAEAAIRTGISIEPSKYKPYELNGSVAIIRVVGVLLHNYNWSDSYATGYQVIQNKVKHAREDSDVKGILMIFHTPGGSVSGCPDTADLIAMVGKEKPIWSLSEDAHLSAGQWLASQATRRLGTQSCHAGSIGVVVPHIDYSGLYKDLKISVDFIFSGKHKVDGNPYQAMSKEVRDGIQSNVDSIRTEFATAVARGTNLSVDAILETEAQVYRGSETVDIGLIDEIVSPIYIADEFNEHLASAGKTTTLGRETIMTDTSKQTAADSNHDVVAIADAAKAEERTRISSILSLPEAEGRQKLAATLTANGSITVESAKTILSAAAIDQPEESESEADTGQQALDAIGKEHGAALQTGDDNQSDEEKDIDALAASFHK